MARAPRIPRRERPVKGGGERMMRHPAKRKPRAGRMVKAMIADLQGTAAAIIDEATGEPHGARILKALVVLATGTQAEIGAFFGDKRPYRLRPRDRQAALAVLEQRRFGRVPQFDGQTPDARPVQIVNVFASSEEFAFVTTPPPQRVVGVRVPPREEDGHDEP